MEDANITEGDYVLIERCQTACNTDIIAVALEDEATLKRFRQMGDTILLIPENANYEPMQVRSDQISILGKAIGVLKKQQLGVWSRVVDRLHHRQVPDSLINLFYHICQ